MEDQLMCQLLVSDPSEIADEARLTIPRFHKLWCRTAQHIDVAADDSDDGDGIAALVRGTSVCNSGPRLRPSSRREVLLPVSWMGGAS